MNAARHFLAIGLLTLAMPVHAAWDDNNISDILNKVTTIFNTIIGNVKGAADDLIELKNKRTDAMRDGIDDFRDWFENRKTPLRDFVSGGQGRCGTGSACAQFRTDLRTFALQMSELKDRFPVVQEAGLGDTTLFADMVKILPPFVLFGIHEFLNRIPGWQDLPVVLADIFDEIDDAEAFSTVRDSSAQVTTASVTSGMKTVQAAGWGKFETPLEKFCVKGKEPNVKGDNVRFHRVQAILNQFKIHFDTASEFPDDKADFTLGGFGTSIKIPTKAFLKLISNTVDAVRDLHATHRANLAECAAIEADVADCVPLVKYRTRAGSREAAAVVQGVLNRSSLAEVNKKAANGLLTQAKQWALISDWKAAYSLLCQAYDAI